LIGGSYILIDPSIRGKIIKTHLTSASRTGVNWLSDNHGEEPCI